VFTLRATVAVSKEEGEAGPVKKYDANAKAEGAPMEP
jgi:hypothetical protein